MLTWKSERKFERLNATLVGSNCKLHLQICLKPLYKRWKTDKINNIKCEIEKKDKTLPEVKLPFAFL